MELEPIGRVEAPEELDLGPIIVPIIGYKKAAKGNVEVVTKIKFKRRMPFKFFKEAAEKGIDLAAMTPQDQLDYLTATVEDEDKEKFLELVFDEDVYIERATLREVFKRVDEARANRPTKPRDDSSPSTRPAKKTTKAASGSRASGRKR
jgi:hypothetical protein